MEIYLIVACILLWLVSLSRGFRERMYFLLCAGNATSGLVRTVFGDPTVLPAQYLLKECIHELGHTLNLRHCQDYQCAMASSHSVEWIDLRDNQLCEACRRELETIGSLQ